MTVSKRLPLAALIRRVDVLVEKFANQQLQDYQLTHGQFKILMVLIRHQDQLFRQIDLEHYFTMTNPTITGLLNKLESGGWIRRQAHPEDARSKVIVLTEKAKYLAPDFLKVSQAIETYLLSNLSEEDSEKLRDLLERVLKGSD